MKKIALFTTDWNYELVGETLRGALEYLDGHPDVSVQVFDCFGVDESAITDRTVYEIYRLVDWGHYDGAVVQTHQIVMREVAGWIERSLQEKGIPAVSLGVPLGNYPQIKTDDYHAFRHITDHLIRHHGAKKLWFLTGLERFDETKESESRQRRYGFLDACREAGIPEENLRILEGNWQKDSGERAARLILEAEDRPDALVCANDDMAMAAVSALQKGGVRVPEEIRVTGFDGIFSAMLCTPRLATMSRNFQNVGYRAVETLCAMLEGREVPEVTFSETRDALTGTCGCRGNADAEIIQIKDRFYRQTRFLREFYLTQDKIAGAFFSAERLEDVMDAAEKYASIFGGGALRVYLDRRYYLSMVGQASPEEEAGLADGHYSGKFVLTADSRRRIAREIRHDEVDGVDSRHRSEEGSAAAERLVSYYPIRFGQIMAGVVELEGFCAAAEMNLHESIINELALSLETIRQHQRLIKLNEKLNVLYATDQLTGLNNRFGVEKTGRPLFERLKAEGKRIAFVFLDVDDMKGINDRYGHATGDEALRISAEALRRICRPGDYLMRYGGDEFVAFGPEWREDPAKKLDQVLEEICEERQINFDLHLSLGMYVCEPDSPEDLKTCLQAADMKMYQIKKSRKRD